MGRLIKHLRVFVGSPSDCKTERDIVHDLIPHINAELETLEIPVRFDFVDWERGVFPEVGRPQEIINEVLDTADVVILIFWHRFGTDAGRRMTGTEEEFYRALERRHREGRPRILVYFKDLDYPKDVDTKQLDQLREFRAQPAIRATLLPGRFSKPDTFRQQATLALLSEAKKYVPQLDARRDVEILKAPSNAVPWDTKRVRVMDNKGFESTERVFGARELEGRVFAIELLTQPLQFAHKEHQKVISLNRRQTRDAIYTGPARRTLHDACLDTSAMKQWAEDIDLRIHDFLQGRIETDLQLPLDKCPLRWGSGGVFPIVSYRGRTWTSFFFRDIWPSGWNIPLGASERNDDLQNPWSFVWREFLEELLVLRTAPEDVLEQDIEFRHPVYPQHSDLWKPDLLAEEFSKEHVRLRQERDGLRLHASRERNLPLETHPTGMTLEILGSHGQSTFPSMFFVVVNPREIGVEAVAPVSYSMDEDDYLLDGEILKPEGREPELVRMPIALISHEYLRRSFGDIDRPLRFVSEDRATVLGDELHPDDIVIFDWDIRRRAVAGSAAGRDTEVIRHRLWIRDFAQPFQDALEKRVFSKQLRTFTATSAKVASYYLL